MSILHPSQPDGVLVPAGDDGWAGEGPAIGDVARVDATVLATQHRLRVELAEERALLGAAWTRRLPFRWAAATAAVGAAGWGCTQIVGALAGPDGATAAAAITWAGTAAAVPTMTALLRHQIPELWRRRWWWTGAASAVYVDGIVAAGPGLATPDGLVAAAATLTLGTWAFGARWFAAHAVQAPGDIDEAESEPEVKDEPPPRIIHAVAREIVDPRVAEIEQDWREKVAAGSTPPAPHAELTDRETLPNGHRWLVRLSRDGGVGCTDLCTDKGSARVALKLGMRATHVLLEPLEGDDAQEDLAWFTAITRNALAEGFDYDGPRYDDGRVPIGRFADGGGEAFWTLRDNTGVRSGIVTGEQGSGKSSLLAGIGWAARRSGEWIPVFGDGDSGGNSSPLLRAAAFDFAAGPEQVLRQLEGFEALGRVRGDIMGTLTPGPRGRPVPMSRDGQPVVDKMMPCPAYPGFVWILDEFWRLARDPDLRAEKFTPRVGGVIRILRKYGGGVIIGTHSAFADDFGGDSNLRDLAAGSNVVAMRSTAKAERGITSDANAGQLPKGAGYGFVNDSGRRAVMRTPRPDSMEVWLPEVLAFGNPDRRSWEAYQRYRKAQAHDPVADYHTRKTRLEAHDEAIALGLPLPGSPEEKATLAEAAKGPSAPPGAQRHDAAPLSVGGRLVPSMATLARVVPIRPDLDKPAAGEKPISEKAARLLSAIQQAGRPVRAAELIGMTGMTASEVSSFGRELRTRRLAHWPEGVQGRYVAGPPRKEGAGEPVPESITTESSYHEQRSAMDSHP